MLSLSLLLDDPIIWPDEAIYADIARNIIFENRLGTDLLKGIIPGFENHAYWSPPFYMYLLAGWFKIFGFSIINQRLLSIVLGTGLIILFYLLCKEIFTPKNSRYSLPAIIATLLLSINNVFLQASRISRPESLVILLTAGSILCYFKITKTGEGGRKNIWMLSCGFLMGLALITHMMAFSFALAIFISLIIAQGKAFYDLRKYIFFAVGLLTPTLVRLISLYPNYQYLIYQLNLTANSHNFTKPLYEYIINLPWVLQVNYYLCFAVSILFVLYTFKYRSKQSILLSFILSFSWLFTFLGSLQWYLVYPIFFSHLALYVLINNFLYLYKKKLSVMTSKILLSAVCLSLLFINLYWYTNLFSNYYGYHSYQTFRIQIRRVIPPGKTVFLSSIPDAYHPLKENGNALYTFPTFSMNTDDFETVLDNTDYVVFNNFYSPPALNEFLNQYLKQNMESMQKISSPYLILIAKLKDKNLRTEVSY